MSLSGIQMLSTGAGSDPTLRDADITAGTHGHDCGCSLLATMGNNRLAVQRTLSSAAVEQLLVRHHVTAHTSAPEAGGHGGQGICAGEARDQPACEFDKRLPGCQQSHESEPVPATAPLPLAPVARGSTKAPAAAGAGSTRLTDHSLSGDCTARDSARTGRTARVLVESEQAGGQVHGHGSGAVVGLHRLCVLVRDPLRRSNAASMAWTRGAPTVTCWRLSNKPSRMETPSGTNGDAHTYKTLCTDGYCFFHRSARGYLSAFGNARGPRVQLQGQVQPIPRGGRPAR